MKWLSFSFDKFFVPKATKTANMELIPDSFHLHYSKKLVYDYKYLEDRNIDLNSRRPCLSRDMHSTHISYSTTTNLKTTKTNLIVCKTFYLYDTMFVLLMPTETDIKAKSYA